LVAIAEEAYPELLLPLTGKAVRSLDDFAKAKAIIRQQVASSVASRVRNLDPSNDARQKQLDAIVGAMVDLSPATWVRTVDTASITLGTKKVGYLTTPIGTFTEYKQRRFQLDVSDATFSATITQNGIITGSDVRITNVQFNGTSSQEINSNLTSLQVTVKLPIADDYAGAPQALLSESSLRFTADVVHYDSYFDDISEASDLQSAGTVTMIMKPREILAVKDTTDGVSSLGFIINFELDGNPTYTGPGVLGVDYAPTWGYDRRYIIEFSLEGDVVWNGLVPPGGLSKLSINADNDLGRITQQVLLLDDLMAKSLSRISGSENSSERVADWLETIGGAVTALGMVVSLLPTPLGEAMIGVGMAIAGVGQAVDAVNTDNPVEGVVGVLTASIATIAAMKSAYGKIRGPIPTASRQAFEKAMINQVGRVGDLAKILKRADISVPVEELMPKASFYVEGLDEVGSFRSATNDRIQSISNAFVDSVRDPNSLANWISSRTQIQPTHGYMTFEFPGEIRNVMASERLANGAFGPVVEKTDVLTKQVWVAEVVPSDEVVEAEQTGSKGQVVLKKATQWWDKSTSTWQWDLSDSSVDGLKSFEDSFLSVPGNNGNLRTQTLDRAMRQGERWGKAVKVKEAAPAVDAVMFESMVKSYANGFGKYNVVLNNCHTSATDIFNMATEWKFPSWMRESDVQSINMDYVQRLGELTGDITPAQVEDYRAALLGAGIRLDSYGDALLEGVILIQ
jgi:hypothetical protein